MPFRPLNYLISPLEEQYRRLLEREIVSTCETLLDIGCGSSSLIQHFSPQLKFTFGIDLDESNITKSQLKSIHNEYRVMNATDIGEYFMPKSFDCVLASDVIEHLTKDDGLKLISMMEQIATRKVIIFTPNGFLPQDGYDPSPYSLHLSGWNIDEMRGMGYRVIGINGWKLLRGEVAKIKWKPRYLWYIVSLLSQLLTEANPKYAFQLLCVKDFRVMN
jgi:hypothetical protein